MGKTAARRDWPVRVFRLGAEPGDDLSATSTPAQRVAMMWPLAVEAWRLAGRTLPGYSRDQAPVVRRALGDSPVPTASG